MRKLKIANRLVGDGEPCFIVAEIGMNHNGDANLAKSIIKAAKDAGADAVKFQIFTAEKLISKETKTYGVTDESMPKTQLEMYKRFELTKDEYKELKKLTISLDLIFFASVFDEENVELAEDIGVELYKIASCDITHIDLIRYIARKGKPVVLSTGMSSMEEIKDAVTAIEEEGNDKIILLHCISSYPAELEDCNLGSINTLREEFNFPIGYSDHTVGNIAPMISVALGSSMLEKHFTLDKSLPGVDHYLSADPKEFKEMVEKVRMTERIMGSGIKEPTKSEAETKKLARRSIIAKVDISKGAVITADMLIIKRPGTGVAPKHTKEIIGRETKEDISKDEIITLEKLR